MKLQLGLRKFRHSRFLHT